MSEMKVNNINVDLIQDQATIALIRQGEPVVGKATHAFISINVPITSPGDQPESTIRKKAIDEARNALREALRVLDAEAA
ncbi:hypothetical protein [uncultured Enterovirga sp.]|uniref:hypothetical protein n=1 Tax=uncultured Enterovirga sp. TaxID=2026352 RepID=UPI0035C9623A